MGRSLEHPTLKVPYEILNKKFRISQIQGSVAQIEEYIKHCEGDVSGIPTLLESLEDSLIKLSEKSKECIGEEIASAESCKKRSEHLKIGCTPPTPASAAQWRKS